MLCRQAVSSQRLSKNISLDENPSLSARSSSSVGRIGGRIVSGIGMVRQGSLAYAKKFRP